MRKQKVRVHLRARHSGGRGAESCRFSDHPFHTRRATIKTAPDVPYAEGHLRDADNCS